MSEQHALYKATLVETEWKPGSLAHALSEGYKKCPYRQLAIGENISITYASAYQKANLLACYLREKYHIDSGCLVALSTPNDIIVPVVLAAVQMCGADVVMIPPGLEIFELDRDLKLVPVDLFIVFSAEMREKICRVQPDASIVMMDRFFQSSIPTIFQVISTSEMNAGWKFQESNLDTSIILFSSGSTGDPKAIVNRSASFSRNANTLVKALQLTGQDTLYIPVPFTHVFGIIGIYTALLKQSTLVTSAKYRPDTALQLITSTRATIHFGVATMFLRELRENHDNEWDLSTLRAGLVAGAGCPKMVFTEFENQWGCKILPSYGMTETAATLTVGSLEDSLEKRYRSVGSPIPGVSITLDRDTQEILCRTPALMCGVYLEKGKLSLDVDEDGWFHTGDVGAWYEDDVLQVIGRIKDIIIRGGINIFPAEVERLYEQCPAIVESCLIGYPDSELGERTCLCVSVVSGCELTSLGLRNFAVDKIEKCRIPDRVLKLDTLPHLSNGKIDKKSLRAWAWNVLGV